MSPRTGRPTNDPKNGRVEIRISERENTMLEYCMKKTGMSKADILRKGIEIVYNKVTEK